MERDYLLFRLFAPLSAWGDIAVGETRTTMTHPGKSSILGILAAACGIRREQEDTLRNMAASYQYGVAVHQIGGVVRDFHTAQVPNASKAAWATRRDQLAQEDLNTILSSRDYRAEALYTVGVWASKEEVPFSLCTLQDRLNAPAFSLYLGRKSCPPALPLAPHIVTAETLAEAFSKNTFPTERSFRKKMTYESVPVYWEGEQTEGFIVQSKAFRRDVPLSKKRWQFTSRIENSGVLGGKDGDK